MTDEPFNRDQYYRLMSMVYNLVYNRKRLARRLIALREALGNTESEVRDLVVSEGVELLADRITYEQIVTQTRQHPLLAMRAVAAFEFMFGA